MKILLVSATQFEIKPILRKFKLDSQTKKFTSDSHQCEILVTGVGITATAYSLGKHFAMNQYDLVINVGLAGAFDRKLSLGLVVNITTDILSEEGAQDDEHFLNLVDLNLRAADESPFVKNQLLSTYSKKIDELLNCDKVSGITVNTVHGKETSIKKIINRLNPQTESMEGAAFLYACLIEQVPCIQIRAISNYVEKRNREAWQIDAALNNLAKAIHSLIVQL